MIALELATEQAVEKIRELSRMYTSPSDDDEALIYTKYTLRGVSTDPTTTYVLRSSTNDDDLMGMDTWQWWKISFSPGDIRPVTWAVRKIPSLGDARKRIYLSTNLQMLITTGVSRGFERLKY